MIFSHYDKIGFIHIPKTGGRSITEVLEKTLTKPVVLMNHQLHSTAYWAREWLLGAEAFDSIQWFAVARNPVDILTSFYSFTGNNLPFRQYLKEVWFNYPDRLTHGGFLKTYCADPNRNFDLYPNIKLIAFDEINSVMAGLPHLNKNDKPKPQIADHVKKEILEWCWFDVDWLKYQSKEMNVIGAITRQGN